MERSVWKKRLILACAFGLLVGAGLVGYRYYSYIFARVLDGKVVAVSRVVSEVEGYVVAIRVPGEGVVTARTDDPRWALVNVGQCAQAKFFPHPPWNLSDAGTYYRATLLLIRDCVAADDVALPAGDVTSPPPVPEPAPENPVPGAPNSTEDNPR